LLAARTAAELDACESFGRRADRLATAGQLTRGELVDRERAFSDALRLKLAKVGAAVEAAKPLDVSAHCAPPKKLTFDPRSNDGNVEYLMQSELPGAPPTDEPLRVLSMHASDIVLGYFLKWTAVGGVRRDDEASAWDQGIFERVHHLEYVVVVVPRVHDAKKGEGALDAYLAEIDSGKVLCGFHVNARGNTALQGKWYWSSLWEDGRKNFFAAAREELKIRGE
jgi:hypothetical protein